MEEPLKDLSRRVKACRLCEAELPLGPRPVFRAGSSARILIASQAPGTKVHESGVPFDDPSGDRLRDWMGIDSETFYNVENIAIIPMGLCYPGKGDWGDLPPTKRCAPTWRQPLLDQMPEIQLVIAVGLFAIRWHLPNAKGSLTKIVQEHSPLSGDVVPLPHPSPRNNIWLSKNRWFEADMVPQLRLRVSAVLSQ